MFATVSFNEKMKALKTDDKQDEKLFVKMLSELNCKESDSKETYNAIKKFMDLYNVSIYEVMAIAVYNVSKSAKEEIALNKDIEKENVAKLKIECEDIWKEFYRILLQIYQDRTDALAEIVKEFTGIKVTEN